MSSIPTPSFPNASGGVPKPMTASGTTPTTKTTASGTKPRRPLFTAITHHTDGSHTVTHQHSNDPSENTSYAKGDFAGLLDGLKEHLGGESEP